MNSASCRSLSAALSSSLRSAAKRRYGFASHQLSRERDRSFFSSKTGQEHHAFFQEQLAELETERKAFFGETNANPVDASPTSEFDGQKQDAFFAEEVEELEKERYNFFGGSVQLDTTEPTHDLVPEDIKDMHLQRESLFEFNAEEKQAWSQADFSSADGKVSPQLMQEIAEARAALERGEAKPQEQVAAIPVEEHHPSFSHVSQHGDSVHMVDVGHKEVTTRMAQAQSKVILPNSVLEAFSQLGPNELVGPKGPILATAKLAGIMAAK